MGPAEPVPSPGSFSPLPGGGAARHGPQRPPKRGGAHRRQHHRLEGHGAGRHLAGSDGSRSASPAPPRSAGGRHAVRLGPSRGGGAGTESPARRLALEEKAATETPPTSSPASPGGGRSQKTSFSRAGARARSAPRAAP